MRKCGFLLVLVFFLFGCGGGNKPKLTEEKPTQNPVTREKTLPEPSGGFVLAVGGETVTSGEIVALLIEHFRPIAQRSSFEQFKKQIKAELEQLIITKVSNILLYQQAKKGLGEQIDEVLEKAAETEVRKFIVRFEGDYAKAEEALKQMGMDWASFKESRKKEILSYSYVREKLSQEEPITYSELMATYNDMREEFFTVSAMLKFRLIDLQVTDPNRNSREQTKELANELVRRLQAGEDFGELALVYSHGHRRAFGGLWKRLEPDSLAEPYNVLVAEAEKIEPGQIAGPIEAGEHIFIVKLEEKQAEGVEPFEKVQREIEAKIIFDRRKKAIDELGAKLARQAAIGNRDAFMDFCMAEIYRISNQ